MGEGARSLIRPSDKDLLMVSFGGVWVWEGQVRDFDFLFDVFGGFHLRVVAHLDEHQPAQVVHHLTGEGARVGIELRRMLEAEGALPPGA